MRLAASRCPLSTCQAVSINARRRAAGVRTLLFLLSWLSPNPPPCAFISFSPWKLPLGGAAQFLKPSRFTYTNSQKFGHIRTSSVKPSRSVLSHLFCAPFLEAWTLQAAKKGDKENWKVMCLLTQLGCIFMTLRAEAYIGIKTGNGNS